MAGEEVGADIAPVYIIVQLLFSFLPLIIILFSAIVGTYYQNNLDKKRLAREFAFFNMNGKDNLMTLENHGLDGKPVAMNLIFANITVGPSWWQMFVGWLKSIFGGEVQSYSRVLNYGRMEVLQRLREKAVAEGWQQVINVRLESVVISKSAGRNDKTSAIEIYAYGTAVKY